MSFEVKEPRQNAYIYKRIARHVRASQQGIRSGFVELGNDLVDTGRGLIRNGPKTGRLYRIPGRKRRHRASAPGEPPANLTGDLARSQGYKVRGYTEMAYGESEDYAPHLEGGTVKMEPRPHLIKSIEINERNASNIFHKRIKQEHER